MIAKRMNPDVKRLIGFYKSPLGKIARALVREEVIRLAGNVDERRVLGLGFATPYLRFCAGEGRAGAGLHAGAAGRLGVAARGPVAHGALRSARNAADRCGRRPHHRGPCCSSMPPMPRS